MPSENFLLFSQECAGAVPKKAFKLSMGGVLSGLTGFWPMRLWHKTGFSVAAGVKTGFYAPLKRYHPPWV